MVFVGISVWPMARAAVVGGAASAAGDALWRVMYGSCCGRRAVKPSNPDTPPPPPAQTAEDTAAVEDEEEGDGGAEDPDARPCATRSLRRMLQGMVVAPVLVAPWYVAQPGGLAELLSTFASTAATEALLAPAWWLLLHEDHTAALASRRLALLTCGVSAAGLTSAGVLYFAYGHHIPALLSGFGVLAPERVPFTLGLGTGAILHAIHVLSELPAVYRREGGCCLPVAWATAGMLSAGGLASLAVYPVIGMNGVVHGHPMIYISEVHNIGALVFFAAGATEAILATFLEAPCALRGARAGCAGMAMVPFGLLLGDIVIVTAGGVPVAGSMGALTLQIIAVAGLTAHTLTFDPDVAQHFEEQCPPEKDPEAVGGCTAGEGDVMVEEG